MNIITAIYKKLFKTRVNERKLKTQYFEKSRTEFYLAVWVEECSNMLTHFLYKIHSVIQQEASQCFSLTGKSRTGQYHSCSTTATKRRKTIWAGDDSGLAALTCESFATHGPMQLDEQQIFKICSLMFWVKKLYQRFQ